MPLRCRRGTCGRRRLRRRKTRTTQGTVVIATAVTMILSGTILRQSAPVVRAWTTTVGTTTMGRCSIPTKAFVYSRTCLSTAALRRRQTNADDDDDKNGRGGNGSSSPPPPRSYSLTDFQDIMREREMPPPVLDSYLMEEGAGAVSYQPELYETDYMGDSDYADMYYHDPTTTSPVIPEEFLAEPTVRDDDDVSATGTKTSSSSSSSSSVQSRTAKATQKTKTQGSPFVEAPSSPLQEIFASNAREEEEEENASKRQNKTSTTHSHTHVADAQVNDTSTDAFWSQSASRGGVVTTELDDLREVQLPAVMLQIYEQNNGEEFNMNSPRQVSQVLFGVPDKSTNKDVLEGMAAGGDRMADLILQYRRLKATMTRLEKRGANAAKGTLVRSVSTVMRPTTNNNSTNTIEVRQQQEESDLMESSDPLLLVDASSYIFRAYFSMPPIHRSDGMPTGAVMGFCNMLNRLVMNRLLDGEQPRMILAFDAPGPSFRKELYPEYKANRPAPPMDLVPQFELIRHASAAYGIPMVESPGFEADDVIATLATQAHAQGLDVHILSGDKDLMQLITGPDVVPCIHMIDPMSMSRIAHAEVVEKWGVGPDLLGDVLALAGDSADNIPGIPGIGPKIASALLCEYENLENLLENAGNIKQKSRREKLIGFAHLARLSRALVALEDAVPGIEQQTGNLSGLRTEPFDPDRILAFYDEMQFKDVKRRFQNQLQRGAPRKRPKSNKKEKTNVPRPEDFADVPF